MHSLFDLHSLSISRRNTFLPSFCTSSFNSSDEINKSAVLSESSIRLLVIDDESADREHVKRSLGVYGGMGPFQIAECENPLLLEDKTIIWAHVFVVDLDLGVADVDGFDVVKRIKELRGDRSRIYVCSNRTDTESVSRAISLGATAFLPIPPRATQLVS